MQSFKWKALLTGFVFTVITQVHGQGLKLGDNPGNKNPNIVLEMNGGTNKNKGVAFPTVSLTSLSSVSPLSASPAPPAGTIVYNNGAGTGTPPAAGFYYWNGAVWVRMAGLSDISASAPLSYNSTTGVLSISKSTTSADGYLSSTDWNTFNNKENALTFSTGLTRTTNTITVNTSQNISVLSNLTSNGLIKTSGGTGALSIATAGTDYLTPTGSAAGLTSFPTFNQNTTGSAASLTTARLINGVSFNGTADITVSAAAGTLTGSTLAANVIASSLTSLGTITSGGLGTGAVIGGVTMTLGTDANYDLYYRSSAGVLTRLANGTTGQVLTATTGAAPAWSIASTTATGSLLNVQTIISGTTYTPTSGTTKILLQLVGGGGAGGGGASCTVNDNGSFGSGGGGGGYFQGYLTLGTGTFTIAIAALGAGVSGAAGGDGGNTTFKNGTTGETYTAYGGIGGGTVAPTNFRADVVGGNGGAKSTVSTGSPVLIYGGGNDGGLGWQHDNADEVVSGAGGASIFEGAGKGLADNITRTTGSFSSVGVASDAYGAGGGGAISHRNTSTSASVAGGNGSAGIIVIYEYK